MELIIPAEISEEAFKLLANYETLGIWNVKEESGSHIVRVLTTVEQTETISDELTDHFSHQDGFRIMLFAVEATLPLPEKEEEKEPEEPRENEVEETPGRISREELYTDLSEGAKWSGTFVTTVILSSVVAAIGLMRSDVVLIIGAMVIAPLLGPNVAMALAATLGDVSLAVKSLKANLLGFLTAVLVSLFIGWIFHINPNVPEMMSRTQISWGDIVIALAAGSAGVLAFTRGVPAAVIGVMVAVALLPPLVNFGLLAGSGYGTLAIGALLLTLMNITCVNLAGVVTFIVQGIHPRQWWEAEKAKKATRYAIIFWFSLLLVFVIFIYFNW